MRLCPGHSSIVEGGRSPRLSSSDGVAGADTDRSDETEPGLVPLVLALAAPVAVLVVRAGELPTRAGDSTRVADRLGGRLSAFAGLWPLRRCWEEQMRQPLAGGRIHPAIIGQLAMEERLNSGHGTPSFVA